MQRLATLVHLLSLVCLLSSLLHTFSSSKPLFIDQSMHSNCHFNIEMRDVHKVALSTMFYCSYFMHTRNAPTYKNLRGLSIVFYRSCSVYIQCSGI